MKIKVKINKSSSINTSIIIKDDFIKSNKGEFYLIKENSNLLFLDPELIIFNENDKNTSYLLNYIKGYNNDFYKQFKYYK
jgi:hypothetical protein